MNKEILVLLADMLKKQDQTNDILRDQSSILRDHTTILKDHTAILKDHSSILRDHSSILTKHGDSLENIIEMMHEQNKGINIAFN